MVLHIFLAILLTFLLIYMMVNSIRLKRNKIRAIIFISLGMMLYSLFLYVFYTLIADYSWDDPNEEFEQKTMQMVTNMCFIISVVGIVFSILKKRKG